VLLFRHVDSEFCPQLHFLFVEVPLPLFRPVLHKFFSDYLPAPQWYFHLSPDRSPKCQPLGDPLQRLQYCRANLAPSASSVLGTKAERFPKDSSIKHFRSPRHLRLFPPVSTFRTFTCLLILTDLFSLRHHFETVGSMFRRFPTHLD